MSASRRKMGRVVAVLRGCLWALRAVMTVKRALRREDWREVTVPAPPYLDPMAGGRGVKAVIRRLEPTCLESALTRQAWLAAQGHCRDVVVGVTRPSEGFRAHAWVEGEDAATLRPYHELARRRAV